MCLSVVTMGYHVIHLMYVLVINLRVPWPRELMHRGWHTFSSWLSGRNFGALFEVLCVGWIDESEIVWCISYNHTHRYLRWHWSILVTLRFWLMCVLRCYFTMNSRAICETYRNSFVLFYYGLLNRSIRKNNFDVVSYPTIISSFVLRH